MIAALGTLLPPFISWTSDLFYNFRSRPRPLARIFKGPGLHSRERTLSLKISILGHATWSASLKNQGPIFLGSPHQ